MKTFKEILKKPSAALTAMCDGLIRLDRNSGFIVDMTDYTDEIDGTCFGCAATCAAIQASGKTYRDYFSKHPYLVFFSQMKSVGDNYRDHEYTDLSQFERVIDHARGGIIRPLFDFFGLTSHHNPQSHDDRFYIGNHNWKSEIPKVRKLIRELKEEGL